VPFDEPQVIQHFVRRHDESWHGRQPMQRLPAASKDPPADEVFAIIGAIRFVYAD
jgi:hypothetical protein